MGYFANKEEGHRGTNPGDNLFDLTKTVKVCEETDYKDKGNIEDMKEK